MKNDEKPPKNDIQTISSALTGITTERKIGGTTYIVTSEYNENASEGLLDKLWRLIQNDNE